VFRAVASALKPGVGHGTPLLEVVVGWPCSRLYFSRYTCGAPPLPSLSSKTFGIFLLRSSAGRSRKEKRKGRGGSRDHATGVSSCGVLSVERRWKDVAVETSGIHSVVHDGAWSERIVLEKLHMPSGSR